MYNMIKKYFHRLLDGLHLVLVVNVREGVQHISGALEIILNQFPVKNKLKWCTSWQKKYFHQLLDGLHLVLVVDVHEGVDNKIKTWL